MFKVDYDKMMELVGAKTSASARERLRVAKKKAEQILGTGGGGSTPSSSPNPRAKKAAPVGGIDKKSPTKVKAGPHKAAKPEIKPESTEEDEGSEDV